MFKITTVGSVAKLTAMSTLTGGPGKLHKTVPSCGNSFCSGAGCLKLACPPSLHLKHISPTIHHHFNMNLRCLKLDRTSAILNYLNHGKRRCGVPSVGFISHYAQYLEFDDSMNSWDIFRGRYICVTDKPKSSK